MFIQVLQGRCSDADRLKKQQDLWDRELAPGAAGYLGATGGVTDDGTAVAVVRFDSRDSAERNSARPEQDAWWSETQTCFDGEVEFSDYDDVIELFDGGSDSAGFVQVMRGRVSDPAAFRELNSQPMDQLKQMRPEIIGGTVAVADDGSFTQTVYFTSEAEAREGEKQEMPADVQAELERAMGDAEITFLDLHAPWFSSGA